MADFSVSAITVHRGRVLLGLAVFPEGAVIGRGLARYDPADGTFERILNDGFITGIATRADRIFAVAAEGLLEIEPGDTVVRRWRVYPAPRPGAPPPIVVGEAPVLPSPRAP